MKPLLINATDRAVIYKDNYKLYLSKILTLRGISFQNDVLTKEIVKADGLKTLTTIG